LLLGELSIYRSFCLTNWLVLGMISCLIFDCQKSLVNIDLLLCVCIWFCSKVYSRLVFMFIVNSWCLVLHVFPCHVFIVFLLRRIEVRYHSIHGFQVVVLKVLDPWLCHCDICCYCIWDYVIIHCNRMHVLWEYGCL
jgi:hypothetical protein